MSDSLAGNIMGCRLFYIDADTISIGVGSVETPDGVFVNVTSSFNVDITTNGVNGLETGFTEARLSLYDVWLISQADGAQPAGLITLTSKSLDSITWPDGYLANQSVYLGSIYNGSRNNSSTYWSDICHFINVGNGRNRKMYFEGLSDLKMEELNPMVAIWKDNSTSWTTIDFSEIVPQTSEEIFCTNYYRNQGSTECQCEVRMFDKIIKLSNPVKIGNAGFPRFSYERMNYPVINANLTASEFKWSSAPLADGLVVIVNGYSYRAGKRTYPD